MTISSTDMVLYAGALLILFLTPGPVWVALTARALSGGFHAAWPLALGGGVGDVIWPLLAMFVFMGYMLIKHRDKTIASDSRLTRPGMWAGFLAGVAVILGNPKAILFYMGVLPGFFDLTSLTWADIAVICFLSLIIPLVGNLFLSISVDRARRLLGSPKALSRTNLTAGIALICVGLVIPFT